MYSNANILKVIDLKFTKMHGIGNDYIYFDCTEKEIENAVGTLIVIALYVSIHLGKISI